MIQYNLRKGDAIIVPSTTGVGILTKQTPAYWYYFYRGSICKVSKENLWKHIDKQHVKIGYGTTMKRRRKYRKNRILDLHGVRHEFVEEKVRFFLNFVELPCTIVTGVSEEMVRRVSVVVEEYGWHLEGDANNAGSFVVLEKK